MASFVAFPLGEAELGPISAKRRWPISGKVMGAWDLNGSKFRQTTTDRCEAVAKPIHM